MDPLLRVINLTKHFGTRPALQGINFEVYPGEVVGLAGRNGAGKSVLAMLVAGLQSPTEGDIYFDNQRLQWPFFADKLGIQVIHQEPMLAGNLDITSSIFLGHERTRPLLGQWLNIPDKLQMDKEAWAVLALLDVHFPSLREKVANLSSEHRQLISIARVMTGSARLIFVDEPTGLLNYRYQQKLLSQIQTWQQQNTSIIFSSNNLDHLFSVADRIVVLRQGHVVATYHTDETTREAVVAALLGKADSQQQVTPAIWALDSFYRARKQSEKLYHHQTLLEKNLQAQGSLNQQLIIQLGEQVKALDQANTALQAAQRRLLTEREQERKHLARELHDQVIQDLLSTNYQLEDIGSEDNMPAQLKGTLTDIRHDIRELVVDLRRICGGLRPPTIDSLGLGAAIQSYTRDWADRTDTSVMLGLDSNLGRMPEGIELSVFRIVQEALNNIHKHAQANTVEINLKHTSPRMLMISVLDNGVGIDDGFDLSALTSEGHYGLLGISERVALLGGRLTLKNRTDSGLRLEVEIPHPRVEMVM